MNLIGCARFGDGEARLAFNRYQCIAGFESKAWCTMLRAMAHQRAAHPTEELKAQLNKLQEEKEQFEMQCRTLQNKLEVLEGQKCLIAKDREGVTHELVTAQNIIRRLYKELQTRKATQKSLSKALSRARGPLLLPSSNWNAKQARKSINHARSIIRVKPPVLPRAPPDESH